MSRQMEEWGTVGTIVRVAIGAVCLIIVIHIAGLFFYTSYNFTAEVESIDFYGRPAGFTGGTDKTIIRFSDGSVYNLYESGVPDGLKEGRTYQMQWRQPYLLGDERLVVIAEVERESQESEKGKGRRGIHRCQV